MKINDLIGQRGIYKASFFSAVVVFLLCIGLAITASSSADNIQALIGLALSSCWAIWSGLMWADANSQIQRRTEAGDAIKAAAPAQIDL